MQRRDAEAARGSGRAQAWAVKRLGVIGIFECVDLFRFNRRGRRGSQRRTQGFALHPLVSRRDYSH